jgi:hypothetical protein
MSRCHIGKLVAIAKLLSHDAFTKPYGLNYKTAIFLLGNACVELDAMPTRGKSCRVGIGLLKIGYEKWQLIAVTCPNFMICSAIKRAPLWMSLLHQISFLHYFYFIGLWQRGRQMSRCRRGEPVATAKLLFHDAFIKSSTGQTHIRTASTAKRLYFY